MNKFILLFAMVSLGCSGSGDSKLNLNKANLTFQAGDYEDALSVYIGLIPTEGSAARIGAGWCELFLNDYASASEYFSEASEDSLADGYAGWAFALWAQNKPGEVIAKIDWVLAHEPQYVSALDDRIEADQLIWIQSSCYLQLGNHAQCLFWIQKLDPAYNVDINDTVNVAGLLLLKLQSLGNVTAI